MAKNDGWFGLRQIRSWFSSWQWSSDSTLGRFFTTQWFNSTTPVLIDTNELVKPYLDCPHLRIVIDKRGDLFSNGQWKCVSVKDDKVEFPDDDILKLLKRPNPFQSGEDFLRQYLYYKDVYANNFIYKLQGSTLTAPKAIWNLPSEWMEIKFTGKIFKQTELSEIIERFFLNNNGQLERYEVSETAYKPDRFSIADGKGLSKIPTLQLPVSNIIAALKTRNILIVNKGMIGFVSSEGRDAAGVLPMIKGERDKVEKEFESDTNLYSDRPKVKIVSSAVRWNPTSYPTKDLALFEEIEDDFNTIIGAYGLRRALFPFGKDTTFENQKAAERSAYESTIQPEADALGELVTKFLGKDPGRKYILTYDWLPIMQADRQMEETSDRIKQQRLSAMFMDGLISAEAYAEMMGVNFTGTGEPKGKQGGTADSLGKIPLALQQLALARERAITAGDTALATELGRSIEELNEQLSQIQSKD